MLAESLGIQNCRTVMYNRLKIDSTLFCLWIRTYVPLLIFLSPAILLVTARLRRRKAGPSNQRAWWVVSGCQWGGAMQPGKSFLIRDLLGDVLLPGACPHHFHCLLRLNNVFSFWFRFSGC
jgi:hypothetical protein